MNMNIESLKSEILNLQNTRDKAIQDGQPVEWIDNTIAELKRKIEAEQAGEIPEVKATREYEFGADFNAAFNVSFLNDTFQDIIDGVRADVHNRYNERLEELEKMNREFTTRVEQLQEQNSKLIEAKNQATLERNDFEAKYNAATALLQDKDAELEGKEMVISAKQEQIDTLQRQLADAPAPTVRPISVSGTNIDTDWLKEKIAKDQANKPKIYDVKPLDFKGSLYGAVDEQGNPIEIKHLDLGKYNVQESPFRQMAADMVQETVEDSSVTGEQFQLEAPSIQTLATGLDSGTTGYVRESGEEKSETVTRAEFEELKSRVAALEVGKGAVA